MDPLALVIPAFIAGIITFLAPCTLPLVPGYLSFISGSSISDFQDPARAKKFQLKVFLNGFFYVIGFSAVFIFLGSLFGLGGSFLFQYRDIFTRLGGVFVILFGLFLLIPGITVLVGGKLDFMKIDPFRFLAAERQIRIGTKLKPGNPVSSLVFGGTFALGWTPCVGPILGSILTLAASSATVGQGALLLAVFSLGLAIPFLGTALAIGWVSSRLATLAALLNWISAIGGMLLVMLGIMMLAGNFVLWISFFYRFFDFINYDALLDYL